MIHLIDNDTLIKLASYDLLDEASKQIAAQRSAIHVLSSATPYVQNHALFKHRDCDAMKARISAFVPSCNKIPINSVAKDVSNVRHIHIDPGEKVLLSACEHVANFEILTGDRKFIVALANHPDAEPVRIRTANRIVCLEQTILEICNEYGYDEVFSKMSQSTRQVDTVIDDIFGSGQATKIETALKRRIEQLRKKTGNLLKP